MSNKLALPRNHYEPQPSPLTKRQRKNLMKKAQQNLIDVNSREFRTALYKIHEHNPLSFAKAFLRPHLKDAATDKVTPSPKFHKEVLEAYATYRFCSIAAPRGHAKSTLTSFFYAIHQALYKQASLIVLVSDTEEQAKRFLERIRTELEVNQNIQAVFGDQKSDRWSATHLKLKNGTNIFAKGRGAQIRGLLSGSTRPDLIILDDIENEELVRSELRRADLEDWLNASIMPSIEPSIGRIIFIGTILHMDSLLNRTLNPELYPDFHGKCYSAWKDEDRTEPLWPERFDPEYLHNLREVAIARNQLSKYYMEYENNPVSPDNAKFKQEYFTYFVDSPTPDTSPNGIRTQAYVDLGGGSTAKTADPTAIVVVTLDDKNTMYVEDYVNKRMGADVNTLAKHIAEFHSTYRPRKWTFEDTVAWKMIRQPLMQRLQELGVQMNYDTIRPTRGSSQRRGTMSDGKYQRIANMEADFKMSRIKMRKWMSDLQEQLLTFPRGTHDDLIDALAYAHQDMPRFQNEHQYNYSPHTTTQEYQPLYPSINL